jgi:glutamate dehydrogenase (NAD(P)+)
MDSNRPQTVDSSEMHLLSLERDDEALHEQGAVMARGAFATGPNPYSMAIEQFEAALPYLKLKRGLIDYTRHAKRALIVNFPLRRDDGSVMVLEGFRVHHNSVSGPTHGGLRYHPGVTLDEMRAFALWNTWKAAVVNIPFGGASGGIAVDPYSLSKRELERMTRRYINDITPLLGVEGDILGPDLNTNQQTMAWAMDTYSMQQGHSVPGVATGKPLSLGGSAGQAGSTGLGLFHTVEKTLAKLGRSVQGATVAVQGFGRVGSNSALYLSRCGARVLGVSDVGGGVYAPNGLDIPTLIDVVAKHGTVTALEQGERITDEDLLSMDVDVLVLAALGNQIRADNAHRVRARIIAEGGPGVITPRADLILEEEGHDTHVVIPDILASAGGMVISYFEWVQDLQAFFWGIDQIEELLRNIMDRAFEEVWTIHHERHVSLRVAAYILAVSRVAENTLMRGIWP